MSDQPGRWSKPSIYPDMRIDPDDDPRNSEGISPDGELPTLQDYLTSYPVTLLMKCEGLDAEQIARRSVPLSTMSFLGLVRHLAQAERNWRNWIGDADPLPKLYGAGDSDFDEVVPEHGKRVGPKTSMPWSGSRRELLAGTWRASMSTTGTNAGCESWRGRIRWLWDWRRRRVVPRRGGLIISLHRMLAPI